MHPCAKRAPPDARAWDGPCARAASSHEITGFNVRPVQCLHPVPSRPCQLVDRSVRVDLLVAAGWNQAPASPAHEWSMEADFERPCASQPSASTRWYVKAAGSAKVSGDGTRLGAPAPAGCPACDPAGGGAAELQCYAETSRPRPCDPRVWRARWLLVSRCLSHCHPAAAMVGQTLHLFGVSVRCADMPLAVCRTSRRTF